MIFLATSQMLDIGDNSGEFALQITRDYPTLQATVIDLPVVCEVGRHHVSDQPESERIKFQAANALEDTLPGDQDLVTFKSIFHDRPFAA
jgi:O-methyltransferase domain